jgi:hypothetical protein
MTPYDEHSHFDDYDCDCQIRKNRDKYLDRNSYPKGNKYYNSIIGYIYEDDW